ncbi:MAG: hypothetical protein ACO24O_10005 [Arenimonas sp.]
MGLTDPAPPIPRPAPGKTQAAPPVAMPVENLVATPENVPVATKNQHATVTPMATGGHDGKNPRGHQKTARVFAFTSASKRNELKNMATGGHGAAKNRGKTAVKMPVATGGHDAPPRMPGYDSRPDVGGWKRWRVTRWKDDAGVWRRTRSESKYFSREAIKLLRRIQNVKTKAG